LPRRRGVLYVNVPRRVMQWIRSLLIATTAPVKKPEYALRRRAAASDAHANRKYAFSQSRRPCRGSRIQNTADGKRTDEKEDCEMSVAVITGTAT